MDRLGCNPDFGVERIINVKRKLQVWIREKQDSSRDSPKIYEYLCPFCFLKQIGHTNIEIDR